MRKAKVSGHEGLVKDLHTQGVSNENESALQKAIELKEKRLAEIRKSQELEARVEALEELIRKFMEPRNGN